MSEHRVKVNLTVEYVVEDEWYNDGKFSVEQESANIEANGDYIISIMEVEVGGVETVKVEEIEL